jgi:hypothetical protein
MTPEQPFERFARRAGVLTLVDASSSFPVALLARED